MQILKEFWWFLIFPFDKNYMSPNYQSNKVSPRSIIEGFVLESGRKVGRVKFSELTQVRQFYLEISLRIMPVIRFLLLKDVIYGAVSAQTT